MMDLIHTFVSIFILIFHVTIIVNSSFIFFPYLVSFFFPSLGSLWWVLTKLGYLSRFFFLPNCSILFAFGAINHSCVSYFNLVKLNLNFLSWVVSLKTLSLNSLCNGRFVHGGMLSLQLEEVKFMLAAKPRVRTKPRVPRR